MDRKGKCGETVKQLLGKFLYDITRLLSILPKFLCYFVGLLPLPRSNIIKNHKSVQNQIAPKSAPSDLTRAAQSFGEPPHTTTRYQLPSRSCRHQRDRVIRSTRSRKLKAPLELKRAPTRSTQQIWTCLTSVLGHVIPPGLTCWPASRPVYWLTRLASTSR